MRSKCGVYMWSSLCLTHRRVFPSFRFFCQFVELKINFILSSVKISPWNYQSNFISKSFFHSLSMRTLKICTHVTGIAFTSFLSLLLFSLDMISLFPFFDVISYHFLFLCSLSFSLTLDLLHPIHTRVFSGLSGLM